MMYDILKFVYFSKSLSLTVFKYLIFWTVFFVFLMKFMYEKSKVKYIIVVIYVIFVRGFHLD